MKIIRSTKCSLKFSSSRKRKELSNILSEYGKVVNFYIEYFWNNSFSASKSQLLKPIVDLAKHSWLSARLRKVAAREAIDMINSCKNRWKDKATMPFHKGKRMHVSSTIADLILSRKSKEFDAWLHLCCIGNKIVIDLPIRFHKHYNKYYNIGKRLNSYIITENSVQFSFEVKTDEKRKGTKVIGIDTGLNSLASLSNGKQYGNDIEHYIQKIKKCRQGSNAQKSSRRALKQKINEVIKEIFLKEDPDVIVVEKLSNMGHRSKVKRLLTKNIRRSIGTWNWRYWLKRLQQHTELNRVSFRSVLPHYTSQTCPRCGHVDRLNRKGKIFMCLKCDHADNADINAGINILLRFIMGPYGVHYKQDSLKNLGFTPNFIKLN